MDSGSNTQQQHASIALTAAVMYASALHNIVAVQ